MKAFRKFHALVCASLSLGILLCGCGGGSASESPSPAGNAPASGAPSSEAPATDETTLNVMWLGSTVQTRVLREYIEQNFSAAHPDIEVNIIEVANNEINEKALLEGTSKTGAFDLVMQNLLVPALVNVDSLSPIDDLVERDGYDMSKLMDNGIAFKGSYYGIPIRGDVRVFHYNTEYFELAGLDPNAPPQSYSELLDYARKLKAVLPEGVYPINYNANSEEAFSSLLFCFGGALQDETGKCVINNEKGVQTLQALVDWYNEGLINPNCISYQYADEVAAYLGGGTAMYDGWPARYIDAQNPEKATIVGKSRVSMLWGDKELIGGWSMAMFNTCKNRDAAWEFMKYCADAGTQKAVIENGGDCNPTHYDVLNDAALQEKYAVLTAVRDAFPKAQLLTKSTQLPYYRQLIQQYVPMAMAGQIPVQEALDKVAEQFNEALKGAGELA